MNQVTYNKQQQDIIAAQDDHMIVVACAGSGKTTSIVGAVEQYLADHPLCQVTAITYTRKAAADLGERINNEHVEISTIHSWALRQLNYFGRKYGFKVQLLEEPVIKDILKKLCKQRNQLYLNQWLLFSYIMGNYNVDVDEKIVRVFRLIADDYVKFKRHNKLYDFTDLPLYLYDICSEYDEHIKGINALFVDEFQDIDPIQLNVFEYVDADKYVYIGDPKQAIYAFRGACSAVFDNFKDDTWGWYTLSTNYRSYQPIIDYAEAVYNTATTYIARRKTYDALSVPSVVDKSSIDCEKGAGGNVMVVTSFDGKKLEGNSWTNYEEEDTENFVAAQLASPTTQILCRSNKQVKKLQTMGVERVSTVHQAKGLEYDNVIVVDFPQTCEEEQNIAYVAATRAKNNLTVIDWDILLYFVSAHKEELKTANSVLF